MVDIISITALIVAVLGATGHFIDQSQIQRLKCLCVDSDCRKRKLSRTKSEIETPPDTPCPPITSQGC
jgi:hypothetical protein